MFMRNVVVVPWERLIAWHTGTPRFTTVSVVGLILHE